MVCYITAHEVVVYPPLAASSVAMNDGIQLSNSSHVQHPELPPSTSPLTAYNNHQSPVRMEQCVGGSPARGNTEQELIIVTLF
jgi:hypothetical protein